jgi:hypothetical protein
MERRSLILEGAYNNKKNRGQIFPLWPMGNLRAQAHALNLAIIRSEDRPAGSMVP